MKRQLKIYFHTVDIIGHVNSMLGLAQALADRGHRITFITSPVFKDYYRKYGFEEIILEAVPCDLVIEPQLLKDPIKYMANQYMQRGFLADKTALEKALLRPKENETSMWEEMMRKEVMLHPQIETILKRDQPDLIVNNHFLVPPSVVYSGIPWVSLFSPNPRSLYSSEDLPPFRSALSLNDDRSKWNQFKAATAGKMKNTFRILQSKLFEYLKYPEFGDPQEQFVSEYLNVYGFPAELDYDDVAPKLEKFVRVDAFSRTNPEPFELPAELRIQPGEKLIYISMGSMGAIDLNLMKRILDSLKDTPYKCIVSKGPRGDEFPLAENMWGQNYLPQTRILPLVDLVVTHGGNNTVTETFSFGKPMVVLPLFADQYDNATRVMDKGFGIYLEAYRFSSEEMKSAVEKLLTDPEVKKRCSQAAERIKQTNSKQTVCQLIEDLVEK